MTGKKLLIAGGGTGGHLFSGLAIAEEWKKRGGDVVFVGTPHGLENQLVPKYGFALQLISVAGLKGKSFLHKLKVFLQLPVAALKSLVLLQKNKPDYVLGIGGYASGPTVLLARLCGFKTGVIEQNSVPGATNRFLARWVHHVFLNFAESKKYLKERQEILVFGNPVMQKRIPRENFFRDQETKGIFVCGGSQGAHALNLVFLEMLGTLLKKYSAAKIFFQTGANDYEWVKQSLKGNGQQVVVAPFFDNLEEIYAEVHLVVARAGAGMVTELALWGLPSILVPYPHAADDHQRKNATVLAEKKAAIIIDQSDLSAGKLTGIIFGLMDNPKELQAMSQGALRVARPNATRDIVNRMTEF